MVRAFLAATSLVALAACDPAIPDSAAGVGFDYDRQQRDAQLEGASGAALPAPDAVSTEELTADAAAAIAAANGEGEDVVHASPTNPTPAQLDNPGISDENNFETVGERRSIEDDAARIALNRSQYKVIEPTALPRRPGTNRPNVVAYALQTDNPVGQPLYRRIGIAASARYERNCAQYPSADKAQEEFLARGGPQKDRLGLDPDGDGFACTWDPSPFRKVSGG